MLPFRIIVVGICAFLLGCFSQNAFAGDTGVLKLDLQDAVATAMGGAFTGEADRPSAVYYNPAGMVQMDTFEASVGATWLQPQIKVESTASSLEGTPYGTSKMKTDNYVFPDGFVTVPVMPNKIYLGIGEASDFGGGTDWEPNSFSQYATVKDSLENQDYMLAAAYKITDQWSFGAGAIDDESQFEHDQALLQFTGSGPSTMLLPNGNALFKGTDNAWGFNVGTMFKLNDQNQFGLDYKSPIHHTYDGTLYMNGLSPYDLGAPPVFNATAFSTKAVQKLTLPQSVTLGYSLKPFSKLTINFDLGWTDWSQYKMQTTSYPNVTNPYQVGVLTTANPQSRDWTSVWSESVGVQYAVLDNLRLRVGYEHHQTPIPEATVDTEFPDSDSNAYTVGLGYDITQNLTIDLAYVADFYVSRNVVNTVDSSLGANLSGKYTAFVNVGTASLTYKY